MAKVLLVEDDNNLREIYQARLTAEGYDIVTAQNGEEALVVAKQNKPDLIISDVMMPRISGFEMLDILRNTDELKHTKVIMLTALGQAEDQKRADSLGADKYLVKSQVTLEDIVYAAKFLLDEDGTAGPSATMSTTASTEEATADSAQLAPDPLANFTPPATTEPVTPPADASTVSAAVVSQTADSATVTPPAPASTAPVTTIPTVPAAEPPTPDPVSLPLGPVPEPPTSEPEAEATLDTASISEPAATTPPPTPAEPVVTEPATEPTATPAADPGASAVPEAEAPADETPAEPSATTEPVDPLTSLGATLQPIELAPEPTPVTEAQPAVIAAAPQTIQAEEAVLQAQIDKYTNEPTETPAEPVTEPAAESEVEAATTTTNDAAIAEAVEALNTPSEEAPLVPPSVTNAALNAEPAVAEPVVTEPTPPQPEPASDPAASAVPEAAPDPLPMTPPDEETTATVDPITAPAPEPSPNDTAPIAGKRIIQPITDPAAKPKLDELLAKEEAKEAVAPPAPIVSPSDSSAPPPQPGQGEDPNIVAL